MDEILPFTETVLHISMVSLTFFVESTRVLAVQVNLDKKLKKLSLKVTSLTR